MGQATAAVMINNKELREDLLLLPLQGPLLLKATAAAVAVIWTGSSLGIQIRQTFERHYNMHLSPLTNKTRANNIGCQASCGCRKDSTAVVMALVKAYEFNWGLTYARGFHPGCSIHSITE